MTKAEILSIASPERIITRPVTEAGELSTFNRFKTERFVDYMPFPIIDYDFNNMPEMPVPFTATGSVAITNGLLQFTNGSSSYLPCNLNTTFKGPWFTLELQMQDFDDVNPGGAAADIVMSYGSAPNNGFGFLLRKTTQKLFAILNNNGTATETEIHTLTGGDFTVRMVCTGTMLRFYIKYDGGVWTQLSTTVSQTAGVPFDAATRYNGSSQLYLFTGSTNATNFYVRAIRAGYFGAVALGDINPINELATAQPIIINNKIYFTASLASPNGSNLNDACNNTGLGVCTMDIDSGKIEIKSILFGYLDTEVVCFRSSQVTFDEANNRFLALYVNSIDNANSFSGVKTRFGFTDENLLRGVHVLNTTEFTVDGAQVSCYDVAVIKENGVYYLATITNPSGSYYPRFYSTTDFSSFTLLQSYPATTTFEGAKSAVLNGQKVFLVGGSSSIRVYDMFGVFIRSFNQPTELSSQSPTSHPAIIPVARDGRTYYYYIGFDETTHGTSSFSYGTNYIYIGAQYDTGYSVPKRNWSKLI